MVGAEVEVEVDMVVVDDDDDDGNWVWMCRRMLDEGDAARRRAELVLTVACFFYSC